MRQFNYKKTTSNTAFTMIELSVVILIIAILMFGTFSSSGMVNSAKINVTKDRIDVVYKALGNFLLINKYKFYVRVDNLNTYIRNFT